MSVDAARVAQAFLDPAKPFDRYHYYYTRSKLASDPLYRGVSDALRGHEAPLLDIGCGIGLLAHYLRADGHAMPIHGVDLDERKIVQANAARERAALANVHFEARNAAAGLPAHRGSVSILDVLQFLPDSAAQDAVLDAAIAMLTPGARLVIRTGLADGSARANITRWVDQLSKLWGWMRTGPDRYPDAEQLRARFDTAGLHSTFTPLHGNTPFNNWLVVAEKAV